MPNDLAIYTGTQTKCLRDLIYTFSLRASFTYFILALPSNSMALNDPTMPPINLIETMQAEEVTAQQKDKNSKEHKQEWLLSSIIITKGNSRAIINGQTMVPGDKVDGALVVSITHHRVTLNRHNETISLDLVPIQKTIRRNKP